MCGVDISKGFDSMLHNHAFLSWFRSGVNPFISQCLTGWYGNSSVRIFSGGQLSDRISLRRGVKQGSVLSLVIFNNAIRTATSYLPPHVIDGIDISNLSYADDILLISDNLISIQNAINILHSHLREIGLEIEPTKTEFLVANNNSDFQHHSIRVGSLNIFNNDSIKYLGLPFGPTIKATRELVLSSVLGKLRKTYGLLVRVKGRFDKQTLAIIYNSMFAPHVFFIVPFLKFLSKSDKKRIRVYFFRFCKYFLGIPLWFKNRYIIRKFGIFDITVKMDQQYDRFLRRSRENRINFPLNCLV